MSKRYFINYLESRRDLLVESSPTMIIRMTFDAGLLLTRAAGYSRKRDALKWIGMINQAAGKEIAAYGGAFEV
jgi:hypothetical protein